MKQKVPTSIKLNIHRLSAYIAMGTIFLGSIIGCGQKKNQQNGASDANHMLSQHHIWENPSKLACQNGEGFPHSSRNNPETAQSMQVDPSPFQAKLKLSCHQGTNTFGLEEREYTFSLSIRNFRMDPTTNIALGDIAVEHYPGEFIADLNDIAGNEAKKDLCVFAFILNANIEATKKIQSNNPGSTGTPILLSFVTTNESPIGRLGYILRMRQGEYSQIPLALGASEMANVPLCQRVSAESAIVSIAEARRALTDPNVSCKKQLLESYLGVPWISNHCIQYRFNTECNKSNLFTEELITLLNQYKDQINPSIAADVDLLQIWRNTENKLTARLRIIAHLTSNTVNVGESKLIKNIFAPFSEVHQYGLIRKNAEDYTAVININFQSGCRLNTGNQDSFLADYRQRVKTCLARSSPKLYRVLRKSLTIELYEPMIHTALQEPPKVNVAVFPDEPNARENSRNHTHLLDCATILHETLHLFGLVDEYVEIEHPIGTFRQLGPDNSLMSHHKTRWNYVFSEDTHQNNRSLLSPAHFLMITHHNNPIAAIEDYLICSADAYTENHQTRNIPVSELPSSCRNGSTNWITHPRTNSQ